MVVLVVLLTMAVGFLGLLVAGLLRSHAEILRELHDLGVNLDPDAAETGSNAGPARRRFETQPGVPEPRDADTGDLRRGRYRPVRRGGERGRGGYRAPDPAGLPVQHLPHLPRLLGGPRPHGAWPCPAGARPVIVTKGVEAESESALRKLAPSGVTTVLSSTAWRDYAVPVAPYFVLVDGAGRPGRSGRARPPVVGSGAQPDGAVAGRRRPGRRAGPAGGVGARARDARRSGAAREARIDAELQAAGIEPDDPSL